MDVLTGEIEYRTTFQNALRIALVNETRDKHEALRRMTEIKPADCRMTRYRRDEPVRTCHRFGSSPAEQIPLSNAKQCLLFGTENPEVDILRRRPPGPWMGKTSCGQAEKAT